MFCSSLHYAASLSGEADILELLLRYDANVDALNNDGETPLFFATKSNNKFAASTLIDRKANYRHKNNMGRWYWDHWWGANWQNIVFLYIYLYKVLRQKHFVCNCDLHLSFSLETLKVIFQPCKSTLNLQVDCYNTITAHLSEEKMFRYFSNFFDTNAIFFFIVL